MVSASPLRAHIEAELESRVPGAFRVRHSLLLATILTGIAAVDSTTGGIPISSVTEIWGPAWISSGKTTLLLSLLASATQQHLTCALVDASDCFDPASAHAAGVHLSRLLWMRCGGESNTTAKIVHEKPALKPLEQAFKAADILLQAGGLGLIVVDLGSLAPQHLQKVPLTTWFRFSRVVERMPTALVFLTPVHIAASCVSLVLKPAAKNVHWFQTAANASLHHSVLLHTLQIECEMSRGQRNHLFERRPVQSEDTGFAAKPIWA